MIWGESLVSLLRSLVVASAKTPFDHSFIEKHVVSPEHGPQVICVEPISHRGEATVIDRNEETASHKTIACAR